MVFLWGGFWVLWFGKGVVDLVVEKGVGRLRCWELWGLYNLVWMFLRIEERGYDVRMCGRRKGGGG